MPRTGDHGPGARNLKVRVYQLQVPLTPLLVNRVAPIQSIVPTLVAAMRLYETQFGSIERCLRMKRYGASFYALGGLAEEFWEIDPAVYAQHSRSLRGDQGGRPVPAASGRDHLPIRSHISED